MTDPNRRYATLDIAEHELLDGTVVRYRKRRLLPRSEDLTPLTRVRVEEDHRLDLISSRVYGTPEALWRICDANDCMNPADLLEVGIQLVVPLPQ
jgi:hypothetical protein